MRVTEVELGVLENGQLCGLCTSIFVGFSSVLLLAA